MFGHRTIGAKFEFPQLAIGWAPKSEADGGGGNELLI